MKNKNLQVVGLIFVLLVIGSLYFWYKDSKAPGQYDEFAKCLGDKGLKFYGAFWCPHCQKEKALFGKSKQYLPYVECSTADGNGQTQICKDKGVTGYPTWEYMKNGTTTMESGEKTLQDLADMTSCVLAPVK